MNDIKQFFCLIILLTTPLLVLAQGSKSVAKNERNSIATTKTTQNKPLPIQRFQWVTAIGAGLTLQTNQPIYSIEAEFLDNKAAGGTSPSFFLQGGIRIDNKHEIGLRGTLTQGSNGFNYTGVYGEGLGLNKVFQYGLIHLYYGYNLLLSDRCWIGPYVQLGGGKGRQAEGTFYDNGRRLNYNSPQGNISHSYTIWQDNLLLNGTVITTGLGLHIGVELVPQTFSLAFDASFITSFFYAHEYEIDYQYQQETINFKTKSSLSNLQLGIQLTYLVGGFNPPFSKK